MTLQRADAPAAGAVPDLGAGRGPDWLDAYLDAHLPDLVELRRDIHAHPEIARSERATTRRVGEALSACGIAWTPLPVGTGLIADIPGGTGPRIALRADLDALPLAEESGLPFASTVPGVAHACGHDVHTAVVLGAAAALAAAPSLPGPVRLLFQPAEEVMPGGAYDVIAAGGLADVSAVFAVHCDPSIEVGRVATRVGPITSACDMIGISVSGPGGHTSRPHLTVDLIGALATLAAELPHLMARHLPVQAGVTLVWGAIGAGGASNVIPQHGTLSGTLRVADRATWLTAEPLLRTLVGQILAPFGADYRVDYAPGVPPTVNDPGAVRSLRAGATAALGEEAMLVAPHSSGAEDFAVILQAVPGALLRLGVWDGAGERVDLHSPTFRADERSIAVGIRTLVHTVLAAGAEV
jgi:amidohydrolase